jgi:hypothetical protein
VSRKVPIVAIVCSQYRRCQRPRSPRLVITGDRDSPAGKHFTNAVLIARHRPGKSASSRGKQGPQAMHMIGEDNPGVDAEGRTGAHAANRIAQICRFASPTDPNLSRADSL